MIEPASPRVIPWHRRMEARLAAGAGLIIAASLAAALVVVTRVATDQSFARASDDMHTAQSAFNRLVATRAESAKAQIRLLTAQPVFRMYMTDVRLASDAATIGAMADDYRRQLEAQFVIVTDRHGTWTASPGWPAGTSPTSVRAGINEASNGRPHSGNVAIGGQLFLVVAEPARFAEETLGAMTVGFALDDAVAADLAGVTHVDVNMVTGETLAASSLRGRDRAAMVSLVDELPLRGEGGVAVGLQAIEGRRYVVGAYPLLRDSSGDTLGRLVLLQDWQPTQQVLDTLQRRVLAAGALIFGCALGGALMFSRHMTRPLKDIAAAAGEIAGGNWTRHVPLRGSAEATTLAAAFNEMTIGLRDQADRLQASHERFQSVTESARDAIVSTDVSGAITFWNRSAQTIFDCAETDAMGRPLVQFIAEPDRHVYLDAAALLVGGVDATAAGRTFEIRGLRHDASLFPAEFSLSSSTSRGTPSLTAVVRDVTERKRAEDTLRQREEALRQAQKMEAIGRLAGGVAHDFNNLLTAIRGFSELLVDTFDETDVRREEATEIIKAADSAAGLTRQLLAFSRRQIPTSEAVALDQSVKRTEKMLRRLIGEDVELFTTSEQPLGLVRADPGQIEQVLMNLAVNARDAMPRGGRIIIALSHVEIEESRASLTPGRYIQLAVTDTGVGMDTETASHIFEPFFTTKGEGQGTGLGLATVYGIVQQSGGAIEVESEIDCGTTFRIWLPEVAPDEVADTADPGATASASGCETVLLVEDDDRVRRFVRNVLKKGGYRVLEAGRAEDALQIVQTHHGPIDLLLTDVVMPGLNGRELAQRVVALQARTRVLFMSGYSNDAILQRGVSAGDAGFIQKPFTIDALAAKIRDVLAHR